MRSLHVRNIPDELYEALREAANAEGRSLSSQAVAIFRQALGSREPDWETIHRHIQERRSSVGVWDVDVAALIREDRDGGHRH